MSAPTRWPQGAHLLEFEVVLDVAGSDANGVAHAGAAARGGHARPPRSPPSPPWRPAAHRRPRHRPTPARRAHRDQHAAGCAGQAGHGHAQLRLADRPGRRQDPGRPRHGRRRRRHAWTRLWWDRPYTLAGVDIGAGVATLHLLTSYGARQDIELRTDDDSHGRPLRGDHREAGDQVVAGRRRRAQPRRARATPSRSRRSTTARCAEGGRHQHRPIAAAGFDFQDVRAATRCETP